MQVPYHREYQYRQNNIIIVMFHIKLHTYFINNFLHIINVISVISKWLALFFLYFKRWDVVAKAQLKKVKKTWEAEQNKNLEKVKEKEVSHNKPS